MLSVLKISIIIFLINLNLSSQKNCEIKSDIISVENINDNSTYDLIISIAYKEKEDCKIICEIENKTEEIDINKSDEYSFSKRTYTVYKIKNLAQYSKYKYMCKSLEKKKNENNENNLKFSDSEIFEFSFPKRSGITKVAVLGDWSESKDGNKTLEYLSRRSGEYDSTILLGDLAYNLYTNEGRVGNDFMNFITKITNKIPFMTTSGNHEVKYDYEDFIKRFQLPNKKENKNLYYSFDINNVHFVTIPSDYFIEDEAITSDSAIDKLIVWLKNDLKNTNKKWKVVYMHRPLYCSDYSKVTCVEEAQILRKNLEDIFYDNRVDLILSGHIHNYERLYPIYNSKVDKDALNGNHNSYDNPKYPVYLVCGAAGNINGMHSLYNPSDLSNYVSTEASVCEITFDNDNIFVENYSVDGYNSLLDNFEIIKNGVFRNERFLEDKNLTEKIGETKNEDKLDLNKEYKLNENKTEDNVDNKNDTVVHTNENKVENKEEIKEETKGETKEEITFNKNNTIWDKTNNNTTPLSDVPTPTENLNEERPYSTIENAETLKDEPDQNNDNAYDEYEQEDQMARKAFYLTVIFLTVFIILFIYNLIRCYTRSAPIEKPVDARGYSRELQIQSAVEDDTVLDLSTLA